MSAPQSPYARLSDDEIAALADLVDLIDERTDVPVSLEGLDGFVTALTCSPRAIPPEEYFPVLFDRDDGLDAIFEDEADMARFLALFERRRNEIARALAAPIEDLTDPRALSPLIMDWNGLLAELPPAEAGRLKAAGIPLCPVVGCRFSACRGALGSRLELTGGQQGRSLRRRGARPVLRAGRTARRTQP